MRFQSLSIIYTCCEMNEQGTTVGIAIGIAIVWTEWITWINYMESEQVYEDYSLYLYCQVCKNEDY